MAAAANTAAAAANTAASRCRTHPQESHLRAATRAVSFSPGNVLVGPVRTFLFGFIRVFLLRTGRQTQVPEWGGLEVLLRVREFGSEQSL
jgi:hypothetical protein